MNIPVCKINTCFDNVVQNYALLMLSFFFISISLSLSPSVPGTQILDTGMEWQGGPHTWRSISLVA